MSNPNPHQEDIPESTPAEWSWQANAHPWTPNQERSWKGYESDANQKIEEAYKSKKETFDDLGEYYIDFKVMLQIHKSDHARQRRVQRKIENDLAGSRAERFTGVLSPIKSISKSTNMTEEFFQKMKKLNFEAEQALKLSNPLNFLLKEVPELANLSLKKMIQEVQGQENKADKEIIDKIKAYIEGAVLDDEKSLPGNNLYPQILKSFTEESFIYKTIHRLLREDNQQKLKEWAPYILLLLYSFSGDKASWKKKKNRTEQPPSALYRGAVLYYEDAELYDKAKNRYFCWNTFTSVSKKTEVIKKFAENFECHKGQYKIFFTIETKSYNESLSILDQLVDVTSFSVFPEEEEVLVCPGTIFEIMDTQIKDDSFHVTLRVVPEDEYWQIK